MKKNVIGALCALGLSAPVLGFAGQYYASGEVVIRPTYYNGSMMAYGRMRAARHSADDTQFIGCMLTVLDSSSYVICSAMDASGEYLGCYLPNTSGQAAMISSVNPDAQILFAVRPDGSCEGISISNHSSYLP
jgi:hypothetical protein